MSVQVEIKERQWEHSDLEALLRKVRRASQSAESTVTVAGGDCASFDDSFLDGCQSLADEADRLGIGVAFANLRGAAMVQFEISRLHRRFALAGVQAPTPAVSRSPIEEDPAVLEEVTRWRKDIDWVLQQLQELTLPGAAMLLQWIVGEEDALYSLNLVAPYSDVIPEVVKGVEPGWLAGVLGYLTPQTAARVLLGDYTRLGDETIGAVLSEMEAECLARVVMKMCVGLDRPRRIAGALLHVPDDRLSMMIGRLDASVVLKIIEVAEERAMGRELALRLPTPGLVKLGGLLSVSESLYIQDLLCDLLSRRDGREVDRALRHMPLKAAQQLREALPERRGLSERAIESAVVNGDATVLRAGQFQDLVGVLLRGDHALAARWLLVAAEEDLHLTAALLSEMAERTYLRLDDDSINRLSARHASIRAILTIIGLDSELLQRLKACPEGRGIDAAFCRTDSDEDWSLQEYVNRFAPASGARSSERTDVGTLVHLQEMLDGPLGRKPVEIHYLHVDPQRLRWAVHIREQGRPDIETAMERFRYHLDNETSPAESSFAQNGLFRLSEELASEGADLGINGNFYFDYGHIVNALLLGIPLERSSGLHFGDPIGWMVHRGVERCPATFNRAAFITTADGRAHIQRVRINGVTIGDEVIDWQHENTANLPDEVVYFNSLFGLRSPAGQGWTFVAVVNNRISAILREQPTVIPYTGFVLGFPPRLCSLVGSLRTGQRVHTRNSFAGDSAVQEAIACGPQLVRAGEIDLDFAAEEFGRKDSTVISFFLPRLADSYDAARSFLGLRRDGTMILGTVSGRAMGAGRHGLKAGLTFGELAQLCKDLGAHDAMGLDGGGSSSLVVRQRSIPRLVNVPTGGADVPPGSERYISTALLGFDKHRGSRKVGL